MANTVKKLEMPDGTIYELADASVDNKLLNYLPLSGGTINGELVLNNSNEANVTNPPLTVIGYISGESGATEVARIGAFESSPYGIVIKTDPDGTTYVQSQRFANHTESFQLSLNPSGGPVLVNGVQVANINHLANYVNLTDNQTIAGNKVFTGTTSTMTLHTYNPLYVNNGTDNSKNTSLYTDIDGVFKIVNSSSSVKRPTYNGTEMALMSDISGNNLCRVYTYESDGSYYLNDNQGNIILTIDGSALFSEASARSIMEGFRQDIFEMPETYPNVTPTINYVVRGYFLPAENMHSNLAAVLDNVFDFNVTTNIGNVDCFIVEAIGGPKSAAECTLKIEICYKNGTSEKGRIVCSGVTTSANNYTAYNETNTYSGPDIQVVTSLPSSPDTNTLYFIK